MKMKFNLREGAARRALRRDAVLFRAILSALHMAQGNDKCRELLIRALRQA